MKKTLLVTLAALAVTVGVGWAAQAGTFSGPEGVSQRNLTFWTAGMRPVRASSKLDFSTSWLFSIFSQGSLTNPSITVNSGYPSSDFPGISGFPVTQSQSSLAPGQVMSLALPSSIVTRTTPGFDSSRSVDTRLVPAGGGQQVVTVSVDLTDARYAPGGVLQIAFPMDVAGEAGACGTTTAASSAPFSASCSVSGDGTVHWATCVSNCDGSLQLNDPVVFTAILSIPNPSPRPIIHVPPALIGAFSGGVGGPDTCTDAGTTSSYTTTEPSLDGSTPGDGSATFSIGDVGLDWLNCPIDVYHVNYAGLSH